MLNFFMDGLVGVLPHILSFYFFYYYCIFLLFPAVILVVIKHTLAFSVMELEDQTCDIPTVICDCRESFLEHFAGKAFSTFSAFEKVLKAFEEATGMQFMMKRTCLFNEGSLGRELLIYRYMHYACVRHIRPASKIGQRYVIYSKVVKNFSTFPTAI